MRPTLSRPCNLERGDILKGSAALEPVRAVAAVSDGKSFFSPSVAAIMLDDNVLDLAEKGIVDRYEALSERQREVLQLVAEGHSSKEVASRLCINSHS